MGVYNDVNDSGKNIIHRIEEFEKNIVGPVMEKEKMMVMILKKWKTL
jgi:hypothetical protein